MKKLIALAVLSTMAWSSFGQGTVDFNNKATVLGSANDYMVRFASDNSLVVGTTYVAQLWYGAVGSPATGFAAISPTAPFRAVGSLLAGTWNGASRTVPAYGLAPLTTSVDLQVRVWDTSMAADWTAASLPGYLGQLGSSAPFTFNFIASAPPATSDDDLINFRGFKIALVPEPSTFALLGLGALGMLIFRRK